VLEIEAQRAEAHAADVGGKNKLEIDEKYNKLRTQEAERFKGQKTDINAPGGVDVSGTIKKPFDMFGGLAPAWKEGADGLKEFASTAEVALSAVGSVVDGLAQGIGSMIQQWVLMGELGPNAVRKMVASILASLAAQAAVEALMELARGFAALASPWTAWEAPLHFKAAAVFGLVAGVAAVAGRVVAGDSFKQGASGGSGGSGGSSGGSGGGSRSSGSSGSSGGSSPIVMGSQRGPDVLHLQVTHTFTNNGAVASYVESAVVKSASGNGAVRQVIVKEVNRQG